MPTPSTIWRRRVALTAAVGLAVAVPVTLAVRDGDDRASESDRSSLGERFPLNPTVGDTSIEATYNVPEGWDLRRKKKAIVLRSADKAVQVGVTSPGPAKASADVLDEALRSLESMYEGVTVSPGSGPTVGGLKAKGAVVNARADGTDLRILVAVAKGRRRAYLVEVFAAASADPGTVAEAQAFLNSLRFEG